MKSKLTKIALFLIVALALPFGLRSDVIKVDAKKDLTDAIKKAQEAITASDFYTLEVFIPHKPDSGGTYKYWLGYSGQKKDTVVINALLLSPFGTEGDSTGILLKILLPKSFVDKKGK